MNESLIQRLIEALILSNLIQSNDKQRAMDVLKKKLRNEIHIVWTIDDIMDQADEDGIELTQNQAYEILAEVHRKHDASVGINWDTVSHAIHSYMKGKT